MNHYLNMLQNGWRNKSEMTRPGMLCRNGAWPLSMCVLCAVLSLLVVLSFYNTTWRTQNDYQTFIHPTRSFRVDKHSIPGDNSGETYVIKNYEEKTTYSSRFSWDKQYEGKAPFYRGDPDGRAKRLPDVILIGAPKGGTFALIQFLGFHPELAIAQLDVDFFHVEEHFRQGYDWYLNHLPKSLPWQLTMEKSPRYMFYDKVAKRIYRMNRDIKLLVIVREPAERAVSCYVHRMAGYARQNQTYNLTFEQMAVDPRNGRIRFDEVCIDTTLYAKHLIRWYKRFPSAQIHIVNGDKLIEDPYVEIKKIEKYLNMKAWFTENMFQYNETKGFFCFKRPSSNNEVCMPPRKGRDHPTVDELVVSKLRNFFRPYNDLLYEIAENNFLWDKD